MDSQKKILLVDSDNKLEKTIKAAFDKGNYKILCADNCISGIHKVIQYHPDLILYNSNLDPITGHEIFKALRFTSIFSHIPVHFYKDMEVEEIKNLITSIGSSSFIKFLNHGKSYQSNEKVGMISPDSRNGNDYDFNVLFNLSPVGMFIFEKKSILSINQMLIDLLKFNARDLSSFTIEDLFDNSSAKQIINWTNKYLTDENTTFFNQVILKGKAGETISMNLVIHELKREGYFTHFLGLLQAVQNSNGMVNYQLATEVCNLLKRENIAVSETLEKKITQIIKQRIIKDTRQKKSFFTRREDEVLRLSMEGLSIKIIADKLSLSTRTVEKYRTKLMLKSGAKNIAEVIVFALKNNLVKI